MPKDNDNKDERDKEIELLVLKSINNQHELNFIKTLLEDNNIPFIVKDYGSGGYMRIIGGSSMYRTEVLVEESMFEKAKSILDEVPPDMFTD